jgi:hypothetical protein
MRQILKLIFKFYFLKALLAEERMQTAEHKVIPLEKEFRKLKVSQKIVFFRLFRLN